MSREKGTPKTGGREKGTPNKINRDVREWLFNVVQSNIETLETDLTSLTPKERWELVRGILPYLLGKRENNHLYRWEYSDEEWEKRTSHFPTF